MSFLLRVALPDRPGSLGAVATALGHVGADIDSISVVERRHGYAVDDLLITLPAGVMAEKLLTAVCSVTGVEVETLQRHPGRLDVHDELTLLDEMATTPGDPIAALVRGLPELLRASYALVVDSSLPTGVRSASPAAPAGKAETRWLPLTDTAPLDPAEVWTPVELAGPDCQLVASPLGPNMALLLARNGGPVFRPSEMLRLAHLARVASTAVGPFRLTPGFGDDAQMVSLEEETSAALAAARRRRADLRDGVTELEKALARPAPGRVAAWGAGVGAAVARMQDIWAGHIEVTEGAQGLYEEILGQAPRLSNQVQRLRREHEQIGVAIRDANDSLSAIDDDRLSTVREELTELVAQLLRHRQRGADLVYEAYHVDIGGGE